MFTFRAIAVIVYRTDLSPEELSYFTLVGGALLLPATVWNFFMLPKLGFTLFLTQCYFCGVFWMIGLAFALNEIALLIVVPFGILVLSTSAPMRTLFSWQVRPDQKGLAMAGYDAVDLFAEALSSYGLTAMFAA